MRNLVSLTNRAAGLKPHFWERLLSFRGILPGSLLYTERVLHEEHNRAEGISYW